MDVLHSFDVRHHMGVLHSLSIRNTFFDKMDLRLFYFHVTKYTRITSIKALPVNQTYYFSATFVLLSKYNQF